jgi:uncharacterized protein YeaO (DUF488 family)
MKIYTSYFAALRRIPEHVVPISICLKAPYWFKGVQYKALAPSGDIFSQQKANPDEGMYTSRFNSEILAVLDRKSVVKELEELSGGNDVVLLCYEKSTSFCHRHLVAGWLYESPDNDGTEWT